MGAGQKDYIVKISTEEIVFNPSVRELSPEKLVSIERFLF